MVDTGWLLTRIGEGLLPWGFAFAFMSALELLLPRGRTTLAGRASGVLFWACWLPVSWLVVAAYRAGWDALGLRPLIHLPLEMTWAGWAAALVAPIAGAAVYDFFFYWCHRAEHRWLWRYHAVHHSIRDMNVVNAFHHPTEPFFQTAMILLPTSLIVSDVGVAAPMVTMLIFLHASFIHSPARVRLGPLRLLLVDNRYHRIHHSVHREHFDHNFGAFTTLWDRVFGTHYLPAADEWPDVGIAGIDQPRTLRQWLTLPARITPDLGKDPATVPAPGVT